MGPNPDKEHPMITAAHLAATLCRSVAPRFTPGDRVRTVGTRSEDADAGIFHGMTDDGKASVGWDSGTRSPIPLAMIEPE